MNDHFLEFEAPDVTDAHWAITNDQLGEWALEKIKAAQAIVAHHEAERAKAIEKWDRYVEQVTREARWEQAWFEAKLQAYLLTLREAGKLGHKKSYRLPSARLQFRDVASRWDVHQADVVEAWARTHQVLKTIIQPDLTEIKRLCAEGVDVPGMVQTRHPGESFSVIFPKDEKDGV